MQKETLKRQRLASGSMLHPDVGKVASELVARSPFFDPEDIAQMKYEMLRCSEVEGCSVTEATRRFGLSRVSFYQARERYEADGLFGLLPHRKGPTGGHKLTGEVVEFIRERMATQSPGPNWDELSCLVEEHFGTKVHPRSIQRRLRDGEAKKRAQ